MPQEGSDNTKWVPKEDIPTVGVQCPVCKQGFLVANDFTAKKGKFAGQEFKSVQCDTCKAKWNEDKYSSKKPSKTPAKSSEKDLESNEAGFQVEILNRLDKIEKRIDKMAKLYKKLKDVIEEYYPVEQEDITLDQSGPQKGDTD